MPLITMIMPIFNKANNFTFDVCKWMRKKWMKLIIQKKILRYLIILKDNVYNMPRMF